MCPKSLSSWKERGFTLIEATVSMTLLLIVLLMSMTFLISMRTFSQRQEMSTQPRQAARRAMDYLTYYIRGAGDMNYKEDAPNALVSFYQLNGASQQATFNNLEVSTGNPKTGTTPTGTDVLQYGDAETDMITICIPTASTQAPMNWAAGVVSASQSVAGFRLGCGTTNNDTANLSLFKSLTGAHLEGSTEVSNPLLLVDNAGAWAYYQITAYGASQCAGTDNPCTATANCPGVVITANPAAAKQLSPPGGTPTLANSNLTLVQLMSFRVKTGQLQQKSAPFNLSAAGATEDALFNTLLDNIEDLQVAYIYDDGNIYNQSVAGRLSATAGFPVGAPSVPPQVGPSGTAGTLDASNVIGVRLSVTGRSGRIAAIEKLTKNLMFMPASEDRAAGSPDRFYHYRLTSTVLLRNRALGN